MATVRGGEKLEAALRDMAREFATPLTVRVGFLESAKYPNGTPVALVAAIQNYGAPRAGIPPRPFFSSMVRDKQGEWPAAIAALVKANPGNPKRALDIAGAAIAGQLRQSIIDTNSPPLSQTTLMIRKMKSEGATISRKSLGIARARIAAGESVAGIPTKPLVDWPDGGHMLNSVDHEVVTR